ncbi:hypothetical protein ALC56_08109 [Trachymyrmex septentrionalis]|uniref:Uncharacterized protein n=1 Tax=Trachymyrmex septentrionalis TaxID=34720 RepID=A0A195FAP6_9HYME|nr:hypothetical protein ALC56_08109 [Trachymyrmex septentrionalis]
MKFVLQPLTIRVTNCDAKSRIMGGGVEKRKHGEMLPSTIRSIICGSSNCGKTNVTISLLESPNGVYFENVYVYSKSCQSMNTSKICLCLSTKSTILRSSTTAMSFYQARRVQILFLSLMTWHKTSRIW